MSIHNPQNYNPQSPGPSLVLVVDDEEYNRTLLADSLQARGFEILEAGNGVQALDLVSQRHPHAVLLDVMMPGIDGFEVCRRLKGNPLTAPIPVLMVTSLHDRKERIMGIEAGANEFLTKPVDLQELVLRVGNAVHSKQLYDDLQRERQRLEEALAQVKQLHGLLPICSYCKKIRDDQNYWHKVESYMSAHADVRFSHGICPDCLAQLRTHVKSQG